VTDDLDEVLAALSDLGYGEVTRDEGFRSASGPVPLPPGRRDERQRSGWRRLLPRVYWNAGDPDLVPADLRAAVEERGWVVQAMGRDATTVTVVVSADGV